MSIFSDTDKGDASKKGDKHKSEGRTEETDIKSTNTTDFLTKDVLINQLKSMALKGEDEYDFEDSDASDWEEYFS